MIYSLFLKNSFRQKSQSSDVEVDANLSFKMIISALIVSLLKLADAEHLKKIRY